MSVPLDEWLNLWDREYLADYIPSGGSTVKMLVADDEHVCRVTESVTSFAKSRGFIAIEINSALVKCHLIHDIFFEVSRSIDWQQLTDEWLRRHMENEGIIVPKNAPLYDMESISVASGVDKNTIRNKIDRLVHRHIMQDNTLWYQFRIALSAYCSSRTEAPDHNIEGSEPTLGWLRGEKVSLSKLRRIRISERIGRHNARPILISLARWCKQLNVSGICLILNLSAVFSPNGSSIRYARPALLDLYELLRQFVDETEEMSHISIVAVASRGIMDDPKMSYDNYDAFKMRVVNDVRDRVKDNPLNTLVIVDLLKTNGVIS